jgi:formiminoglutamase
VAIDDPLWTRADTWLAAGSSDPDLVVAGVPSSSSSLSGSEAWRAPAAMRAALDGFSVFDSESGVRLDTLAVTDLGDWPVAALDPVAALEAIRTHTAALEPGPAYAFLGGDNAISRGVASGWPGGLDAAAVITLDAHHDVRSLDDGPSNGNPISGLIADGLPDGRVVQIGIHSFANSGPYREFCDEHGIEVIPMRLVDDWGIEEAVYVALDRLTRVADWIYVDVDIDVLDRAFAPGCPGARPGGMTPRDLLRAVRILGADPHVTAAGFVEVDPTADRDGLTVMNMASAFLAFASGVARRPRHDEDAT